jgi:hypothetical protein
MARNAGSAYWAKIFRRRLYRATFVLEVLGILVVGFYTCQAYIANRLARQANGLSREALTSVQRAFIYNSGFRLLSGRPSSPDIATQGGTLSGLESEFENSGATPGSEVIEVTNVCLRGGDIDDGFNYRDLRDNTQNRRAMVAPGTRFKSWFYLTPEQVDSIMKFKTHLYVWGWVWYVDSFQQSHTTEFCAQYGGFADPTGATNVGSFVFDQCPKHNCADDNCPKRWGTVWTIECENMDTSLQ